MNHPLHLATLVIDVAVSSCIERIQTRKYTLSELDEKMGQHEYKNLKQGNPLQNDFLETTRQLNFVARNLGSDTMHLSWIILTLKEIAKYTQDLARTYDRNASENSVNSDDCLDRMKAGIEYLENACQTYLLRMDCLTRRKDALLQAVSTNS